MNHQIQCNCLIVRRFSAHSTNRFHTHCEWWCNLHCFGNIQPTVQFTVMLWPSALYVKAYCQQQLSTLLNCHRVRFWFMFCLGLMKTNKAYSVSPFTERNLISPKTVDFCRSCWWKVSPNGAFKGSCTVWENDCLNQKLVSKCSAVFKVCLITSMCLMCHILVCMCDGNQLSEKHLIWWSPDFLCDTTRLTLCLKLNSASILPIQSPPYHHHDHTSS